MKIEKDAEKIVEEFSKTLDNIPDLEETWYITDNLNLTRKDESHEKNPEKIQPPGFSSGGAAGALPGDRFRERDGIAVGTIAPPSAAVWESRSCGAD